VPDPSLPGSELHSRKNERLISIIWIQAREVCIFSPSSEYAQDYFPVTTDRADTTGIGQNIGATNKAPFYRHGRIHTTNARTEELRSRRCSRVAEATQIRPKPKTGTAQHSCRSRTRRICRANQRAPLHPAERSRPDSWTDPDHERRTGLPDAG